MTGYTSSFKAATLPVSCLFPFLLQDLKGQHSFTSNAHIAKEQSDLGLPHLLRQIFKVKMVTKTDQYRKVNDQWSELQIGGGIEDNS